jgi:hypothetical protein
MLKPKIDNNKNQMIYEVNDGKNTIPFPLQRNKTRKEAKVKVEKEDIQFFNIVPFDPQNTNNNSKKEIQKTNEVIKTNALFNDAPDDEQNVDNIHPERPVNPLWRSIEKSIGDRDKSFNIAMKDNLGTVDEYDFGENSNGQIVNADNLGPSKTRLAPKVKHLVQYKTGKDLLEPNANPLGINRIQTRDGKCILEPTLQPVDAQPNEGSIWRINTNVETYRRKKFEHELKIQEQRRKEKEEAIRALQIKNRA